MSNRMGLKSNAAILIAGMAIFNGIAVLSGANIPNKSDIQDWISILEKSKRNQPKSSQEKTCISNLIAFGDFAVETVVDTFRRNQDESQNFRICGIEILEGINTPKSRQILFLMAMDREGLDSIDSWRAARAYMRCVKDKKEVAKLLEAPNLNAVRNEIFRAIQGVDVDDKILGFLNPWLMGPSFYLRQDSLNLLAADPSPEKADDKLRVILQSMQTIEQIQIPLGDSTAKAYDRCQYDRAGTYADILFESATNAMIQVKVPKVPFAELTDSLTGMARYWAIAARANRGDVSVHDELKTIVSDPNLFPRMRLRQLGIQAFSKIGTTVDIPCLKNISDSDPYRIHLYLSSSKNFEWVNETMVNNTGPRAPMLPEEPPTPRSMTVLYPIRSAAQEAIKAIEAKSPKTLLSPWEEKSKSP
jgi:hypothetical protein